jgi:hypothetical protein
MDKIKAFWATVKDVFIYVLGPIAALLAYIFFLTGKNRRLEHEIESAHFDNHDQELSHAQDDIDRTADAAVREYQRQRDEFLSGSSEDLRRSNREPKKGD